MSSESLKGQVAIITGGSSGIGVGVAEELRAAGMKLVLTARREERLREVGERLGNCELVIGDITDPAMPQRLIDCAVKHFGRCDVVFNSAGIMHAAAFDQVDVDKMCDMIRVNFEAATRMAYTALAHFRAVGGGHLVNVSSIFGTKVRPNAGVYAGTKYAIEALSEALRMEVAKTDIKVSVIEPGVVVSELQDHFPVHPREALGITQPLLPADIGRCVRFIFEQPPHVRIPRMMILPGEQPMQLQAKSTAGRIAMGFSGLHWLDWVVLIAYFGAVIYLGVFLGAKKTKNLGDFFVAGGKWGPIVSFIFVFASALAGNEAILVSSAAYTSGLAGFWMWGNFIFATPIYFLFATYYRRARVYNLAEFTEMRFGTGVAALYSLVAGIICVLFIATFLLAVSNILNGALGFPVQTCIWTIAIVVAAYVYSGGMMSTLITDLLQGLMCLFVLGFLFLPFLWHHAGGLAALRSLPPETWNFTGPGMELPEVAARCLTTITGGIAAPWIYSWIAVSKDEKTATQCSWAHLWKRIATLMFTIYGILFAIVLPNMKNPDLAWGAAMKDVLPVGTIGLMIASFFAAVMSSAATYATTSAAMLIDYFFRKLAMPNLPRQRYLAMARVWAVISIVIAAGSTLYITSIQKYVDLSLELLCFLGISIYFGIVWRKSNRTGMWLSLILGIAAFVVIKFMPTGEGTLFPDADSTFVASVFVSTAMSLLGMIVGTLLGPAEDATRLNRFYVIMNTPIGEEQRLVDAGIRLPALVDAGLVGDGEEQLRTDVLNRLYLADAQQKMFGANSSIELRRERLAWYLPGFIRLTSACVLLIVGTWLITRILFVWG